MGLTSASLLITQQMGISVGLMARTCGFITDAGRGVDGVEWAVPLYKGLLKARLDSGNVQTVILAFKLPWQLLVLSAGALTLICLAAALLSVYKVIRLEPAVVFKG